MTDDRNHIPYLEHVLLPLLDKEQALTFLRTAAPGVLQSMEGELLEASRSQSRHLLERVARLRKRVQQARSSEELAALSDPILSPSLVLDPHSPIWEEWPREDLRRELAKRQRAYEQAERVLEATRPGSLQYHQHREEATRQAKALLQTQQKVLGEWLHHQEQRFRAQTSEASQVTWDVDVQLQVPLVAGNRVVDFLDAQLTVTARTSRAFLVHAFGIVVLPPDTSLLSALRRLHVIQHFLPRDTDLIAVTVQPAFVQPLQQHKIYTYLAQPADSSRQAHHDRAHTP